jgi:hypothetical protein
MGAVCTAQKKPFFDKVGLKTEVFGSHLVASHTYMREYGTFAGLRFGVFGMRRLSKKLYGRVGILFSFRRMGFLSSSMNFGGGYRVWDWRGTSTPLVLIYQLSPRIDVGAGVEVNTVFKINQHHSSPLPPVYPGIRITTGFQLLPKLRIGVHYTHIIYPLKEPKSTAPNVPEHAFYNNILVGLNVSFSLYDWKQFILNKEFKHPCPRF